MGAADGYPPNPTIQTGLLLIKNLKAQLKLKQETFFPLLKNGFTQSTIFSSESLSQTQLMPLQKEEPLQEQKTRRSPLVLLN